MNKNWSVEQKKIKQERDVLYTEELGNVNFPYFLKVVETFGAIPNSFRPARYFCKAFRKTLTTEMLFAVSRYFRAYIFFDVNLFWHFVSKLTRHFNRNFYGIYYHDIHFVSVLIWYFNYTEAQMDSIVKLINWPPLCCWKSILLCYRLWRKNILL